MTAYAIVRNGRVVNIAEADVAFAQAHGWIAAGAARVGDLWDGQSFSGAAEVVIPATVTRRQARQALLKADKLAAVQPALDAILDPLERGLLQIAWDDSLEFERGHPAIAQIGAAIGLTSQDIDNLFLQAATL